MGMIEKMLYLCVSCMAAVALDYLAIDLAKEVLKKTYSKSSRRVAASGAAIAGVCALITLAGIIMLFWPIIGWGGTICISIALLVLITLTFMRLKRK